MGAADGDLGFFGVVHAELVAGFEPGHDLADVLDVDDEGAVGAPECFGIELVHELFEGAAVGLALDATGDDGDGAAFDGGEADLALVDEEQAAEGADDDLAGGWFGWRGAGLDEAEEGVETGVGCGVGAVGQPGFHLLHRLQHALAVEGLQQVIDGVDLKGADGVLVEGGGEDDLREAGLLVEEFFEDGEAIEAGHLDVEEDDVGLVGADEVDGLDAVGALGEDLDAFGGLEQVEELLAGEGFVVDDEGGEGHGCQLQVAGCRLDSEAELNRQPKQTAGPSLRSG